MTVQVIEKAPHVIILTKLVSESRSLVMKKDASMIFDPQRTTALPSD
jgi:hypothetical protein